MTLSTYASVDDVIVPGSAACASCVQSHQGRLQQYTSRNIPKNHINYRRPQGLAQFVDESPFCTCDCHNLKVKKPTIDKPLSYGRAKREVRRDATFEERANAYYSNEGIELKEYLHGKGRKFYELEQTGTANLEDAIAAVAMEGDCAILIGNKNFEAKVTELARAYGVSQNVARRYVFDHETVHLSQKGRICDDHIVAERDVESTLAEYYDKLLKNDPGNREYAALKGIASERYESVPINYASDGEKN